MAEKHIANKEANWRAVNSTPDFCKVGTSVVPFDIFQNLSQAVTYSPNVYARGVPVLTVTSRIKGVIGDTGSGVASQVSMGAGDVVVTSGSSTVNTNKLLTAFNTSDCLMNVGATPNCTGRIITDQGAPAAQITANKLPCNDPPKSSPRLEELKKTSEKLKSEDPRELFNFIETSEAEEIVQGGISQIQTTPDSALRDAAGMARGTLGVANRFVFGLANFAKMGAQELTANRFIDMARRQIEHEILAENMRLGSCVDQRSLWQKIKDGAKQAVKPITEPWSKGEYSESAIAATGEILLLLMPGGESGKAGQAQKVAAFIEKTGAAEAKVAKLVATQAERAAGVVEEAGAAEARAGRLTDKTADLSKPASESAQSEAISSRSATERSALQETPSEIKSTGESGEVAKSETASQKTEGLSDNAPVPDRESGVQVKQKLTNHQKAEFGEKMADKKMEKLGYGSDSRLKGGSYKPGETGIDGIYKNPKYPPTPPEYIITEAKYNTAQLGRTTTGKQMSDAWLTPERLRKAVGEERAVAIMDAMEEGRVEKWLLRVDEQGSVDIKVLDEFGNLVLPK